jgi:hypothetical protein
VWQPALKTAGLPKTLRMHDLRHAQASWLFAGGADLKTVMDGLGHSQITTTQRYLHALESTDDTGFTRRLATALVGSTGNDGCAATNRRRAAGCRTPSGISALCRR